MDPIYGCFKQWVETSFRLSICKKRETNSTTADQFLLAALLEKGRAGFFFWGSDPHRHTIRPLLDLIHFGSRAVIHRGDTWHRSLPDRWDADSRRPPFQRAQAGPNVARLDKSKPEKQKENRINRRESWMNQNYDVDPHPPTHWNPAGIEFRHQLRNAANIKLPFAWYPLTRWRRHPTLCGRHSTTAPFFDYFVNSYISSDVEEGSRDADIITESKDFVHDSEWVFLSPLTGIEIRHASLFRSTTPHGLCACVQYRENKRITTTGSDCYYAANRRHACQHPPPTKKTTQENCWYTRQEDALKVGNVMVHPCWFYANFKTLKESHSLEAI